MQPNELTREQREERALDMAIPERVKCAYCGFSIDRDSDIAYMGTNCAHKNRSQCSELFRNHINELEAQLKDAIERCQELNGIEARIEDLIAAASESGKYPKLHAWFDGDGSSDTDIDRGVQIWISELEAQLADARRELLRKHLDSPDMQTFVNFKDGIVGDVLLCLQEGEISLSKAAEALAEIAHGAATVPLPSHQGYFDEMETPVERCISLETALRGLRTEADSALALAAMRGDLLKHFDLPTLPDNLMDGAEMYLASLARGTLANYKVRLFRDITKALESTSPEEWLAERDKRMKAQGAVKALVELVYDCAKNYGEGKTNVRAVEVDAITDRYSQISQEAGLL